MSEIMSIYKINVPRYTLDVHTGKRYPNGHKIFYVIRGEKESYSKAKLKKLYTRKRECEFTSQSIRDWFYGEREFTLLEAQEMGSNSLAGDLLAYFRKRKEYESACNNPPPVRRQTSYHPKHKHIEKQLGHTMSQAILAWRKSHK
jgi:hypothetical protein